MFLEKIELQGFKSFANKTTLIFPKQINSRKGITAIVGPNGSGKSNIADAARWVLGEQSMKHLRGKKSEDVIFSGSDKKSALGLAEVSLYLNNEDGSAPIDYTEMVLTRRLYRSGESEYLINKNKARLNDILLLLAKANFGQRTYSIIGQGMIEAILIASLQERKDFFDEAVGVKQYQIKKDQALNKFKATRENIGQAELTLKELEPRLRSLQRQVKKLEKRQELEKTLRQLQLKYYSFNWQSLNQKIKSSEEAKQDKNKEINKIKLTLAEIEKKINAYALNNEDPDQFKTLQHKYHALLEDKNKQLRQIAFLKGQSDLALQKQGKSDLIWLNQKLEDLDSKIKLKKEELKSFEKSLEDFKKREKDIAYNLENILPKLESLEKEIATLKSKTDVTYDQDKDIQEIFNLQQQLVIALSEVKNLEELESIKENAKVINQKLSLFIEKKGQRADDGLEKISRLQEQLNDLLEQKNKISLELQEINLNIKQKQEDISDQENFLISLDKEKSQILQEIKKAQIDSPEELKQEIENEKKDIETSLADLDKKITEIENRLNQWQEQEQEKKNKMLELQKDFQQEQTVYHQKSTELSNIEIELAKLTTKKEDLEEEIFQELDDLTVVQSYQNNNDENVDGLLPEIQQLKRQLEIIGGIDEETKTEFQEISERFEFLSSQSKDLKEALISLEKIIEELDETIKKQFDKNFKAINKEFQRYFTVLFNGGKANLIKVTSQEIKKALKEAEPDQEAEEEEDTLAKADNFLKKLKQTEKESYAGIEIQACPPGKKLKSINMLSGGEKALTSIALICAIISVSPSPFIVLDEVDAALDEANSERFASIVDELSQKTQFIVITHNRATMHRADVIYGVTMTDDSVSHLLSIQLEEAEGLVNR